MAQTYTTQWFNVSNGDVTTHNPQTLAPTSKQIRIVNAEIQWEGVDTQVEEETTSFESVDSTAAEPSDLPISVSTTIPSDGYNTELFANLLLFSGDAQAQAVFDTNGDGIGENTSTLNADSNASARDTPGTGSCGVTVNNYSDSDGDADFNDVTVQISWEEPTTEIVTKSTQDPRVTRDVSADSGTLTLNDGEQSSWYQLDGLAPNAEEFYHDISGSREARFRFRFDWENIFPDAVTQLRVYDEDTDTTRLVALADPSDSQLDYTAIRSYVQQAGQTLVVDVVDDPTDVNAIASHRIYHPVHGTLYLRAFDSV